MRLGWNGRIKTKWPLPLRSRCCYPQVPHTLSHCRLPATRRFDHEAAALLQDLRAFPALERRSAADLAVRLGPELARVYALPPAAAGRCC